MKEQGQVNFPNLKNEGKTAETTTPRSGGAEYDKWRLAQSRKLLKTHHALIKEAHDIGHSASETGGSDGSDGDDRSQKVKIGQSTWNECTPADFLLYFRRGFRDDQMTLNNKVCFVERMDLIKSGQDGNEEMIDLMITFHPLDFLVKLGYSAEEAALISQDEEIKCRLYAAIREARIWANSITKPQAALLYLLAHKAKPKIMRYYLSMVESIINRRILNAVKLNELIDFLECLEDGEIALKDVFDEMAESEELEEKKKTEDLYTVFHHMAEEEAMNCGRYPLSAKQIFLLQTLVSKYHIALQDHLALLTCYIGRGLIKNTVQLEAALVYLPHVARHSVNFEEFEQYCGIKSRRN
ncbi:uncharacterized protein LOC126195254 [Schistocerca nitens]|uniref:uncharacterized protein LOC126195254 n=1 Tax=Schistocerca nitens TaxID=7011 RepID=UPI00211777EF|nr:uncharacterized protein LOC126195254 [Schistocerca nitens]